MKKLHLIFGLFVLLLISCRDDSSTLIDTEPGDDPTVITKVRTSYNGFVYKNQSDPIQNAEVFFDGKSVLTNALGYFEIDGDAGEQGGLITVKSDQYFDSYAVVAPSENGRQHVRFIMREKVLAATFNAGNPMPVTLVDNTTTVRFAANAFSLDGNVYNGEVEVYMDYLDPSGEDFERVMPGNLLTLNEADEYGVLESFGMVNVEIQTPSGDKLEISENAILETKVPEAYLAQAPTSIPLWYFDETTGLWIEEGSATLEGDKYVGEVSHFTLWNCDVNWPLVTLTGNITARTAVPYAKVRVTWLSNGQVRCTYADSNGDFVGKVPGDQLLLVEVLDACGDPVWSQEIGPLSGDEHLNILVNFGTIPTSIISGTLECNGAPAGGAEVVVYVQNALSYIIESDANGYFEQEILTCDATEISLTSFYVQGMDLLQGSNLTVTVEPTIDVGTISTCDLTSSFNAHFDLGGGLTYTHYDLGVRPNGVNNGHYAQLIYPDGKFEYLGFISPLTGQFTIIWQSDIFTNVTFPTTYSASPQMGNWSYIDFGNFIHVECTDAFVTNRFNNEEFPNSHFELTVAK